MAFHSPNPAREQLKAEILVALAADQEPMTTNDLYLACPSATKPDEVAKVAFDMKKKGLIADGGKVPHPRGSPVNSYRYHSPDDPRIEAAKPIQTEPKIKPTRQPAIKRKPAPGHPFAAPIRPQAAHDSLPRVTRPLPTHLQSTAPQAAAVALDEVEMSEDPMPYVTDPDTFSQEPREPEAERDIDAELTNLLSQVAAMKPTDDAVMLASEYVGDLTDAMARRREQLTRTGVLTETPKKVCQCLRINSLPPLPPGYVYGGIKVWIESEHDVGHLAITTHDEGGGPFCSLKASGHLSFDSGDLVAIGRVADALIKLHQEMIHE